MVVGGNKMAGDPKEEAFLSEEFLGMNEWCSEARRP